MVSPDSVAANRHSEEQPKEEQSSESSSPIGLPMESPVKQHDTVSTPSSFIPLKPHMSAERMPREEPSLEEETLVLRPDSEDPSKLQLEERVQQLETKLAVLSRLLQSYHFQPKQLPQELACSQTPSPPPPPAPQTPDRTASPDYADESRRRRRQRIRSESLGSTPHLESPAPPGREVCKTYLEEQALGDLAELGEDETERSEETFSPNHRRHTPNTAALEKLVRPPSPGEFASRQRLRGISMDETVACDNRSAEKKMSALVATPQQQPTLFDDPPTPDSIVFTTHENAESDLDTPSSTTATTPTPAPTPHFKSTNESDTKRRRNLSFRLLYSGDEEAYDRRNNEAEPGAASLSLSERLWLGPSILQFQKHQQAKQDAAEQEAERLKQLKDKKQQHHHQQQQASTDSTTFSIAPKSYLPAPLQVPDESVRSRWLDHLNSFQESTPDVDVQMEEFIKVPSGVENLMSFGFFICVDSFLYMITVLPIRFIWSCFLLILNYVVLWRARMRDRYLWRQFQFHRQHLYQIIQVTILYTIYRYVLLENSIGKLYHWIRGQAMLKLYVLVAIVEIFDRLFSSLGQDCLESMYWNTVSRPKSSRMLISVLVVLIYASLHSILLFVHVVTLHVAMNSTDQVLLTLLISGNFAEIKSTVFKKYNKAALFKISASDICERFKLTLFLSLVLALNVCQGLEDGQLMGYVRIWGIVGGAEMLADWIKHAFITKFNFLPARVYSEYALLLAGDVTGIGHEGANNMDHSHAVVKRIGFAQIPLVCVFFRLLREAARYYAVVERHTTFSWIALTGTWLVLVLVKLALGSLLQRLSIGKLLAAPESSQQKSPLLKKKKKKL